MQNNPISELYLAASSGHAYSQQLKTTLCMFYNTKDESRKIKLKDSISELYDYTKHQIKYSTKILGDFLEGKKQIPLIPNLYTQNNLDYIGGQIRGKEICSDEATWEMFLFMLDKNDIKPILKHLINKLQAITIMNKLILNEYTECQDTDVREKIEDMFRVNDHWTNFTAILDILYMVFHYIINDKNLNCSITSPNVIPIRKQS